MVQISTRFPLAARKNFFFGFGRRCLPPAFAPDGNQGRVRLPVAWTRTERQGIIINLYCKNFTVEIISTVLEMPSRPSGAIWNAGRLESGIGCQAGFSARVPQGIRPDSTRRQGNGRATGHPAGHPLPPSAPRSPHSRPGRAARAFADGRRTMCRQRTRTRHGTFLKFRRRCPEGPVPRLPDFLQP